MTNSDSNDRTDGDVDEQTRQVWVTIHALIPEFRQARARDATGHEYAITSRTDGIEMASLREGQSLVCTVTLRLPRVLRATLAKGETPGEVPPIGGERGN